MSASFASRNEERDRDRSSEGEAVGLASPSVYPAPLYSLG